MGKFKELSYEIKQENPRNEPDELEFLTKKQYNQMMKNHKKKRNKNASKHTW